MSDLKLYNLNTKKIIKKNRIAKPIIREFIEENLEELLGIKLIFKDFPLVDESNFVEILGYDENYQIVVVEYRNGKFTSTINKGLVFLDYIKNNHAKIKSYLNQELGYDIANNINLNPRLIVLGDDFNKYDEYAIKQMPYIVDLIKYQIFENKLILLEKNYQSTNSYQTINSYKFNNDEIYSLYKSIKEFVLSLGDEVCEVNNNHYIAYRKIKNFLYVTFTGGITLNLKFSNFKSIKIKNYKDVEKALLEIEKCYDEN